MTQLVAPAVASGASLATLLASFNKFGASTATAVNAGIEGGAASNPNIAASTVDITNMRANASIGTYAAEAGYAGFVVSEGGTKGLQYLSASGLTATYTSGSAWVVKTSVSPDTTIRATKTTNWTILLTANSDNYVYINASGAVGVATTTVGGPAPSLPTDTLGLSIATTNGTTVTGTPTDTSPSAASSVPVLFRTAGAWPTSFSASTFTLPPGQFEVNGLSVKTTINTSQVITVAGNFVSGSLKSNTSIYFVVANNSGAPKYGLTSSAASAATIVGGVATGSVGLKQYRTIGGLIYRYLGGWPVNNTATLYKGVRTRNTVQFISMQTLGVNASADQAGFVTANKTSIVTPATASHVLTHIFNDRNNSIYLRPSTAGTGWRAGRSSTSPGTFVPFTLPISGPLRAFQYRSPAGTGTYSICSAGYVEGLD